MTPDRFIQKPDLDNIDVYLEVKLSRNIILLVSFFRLLLSSILFTFALY